MFASFAAFAAAFPPPFFEDYTIEIVTTDNADECFLRGGILKYFVFIFTTMVLGIFSN